MGGRDANLTALALFCVELGNNHRLGKSACKGLSGFLYFLIYGSWR